MSETIAISGNKISLSEGREVWAGEHDNSWYLRFDDGQGAIRKLRISQEAAEAVVKLLTQKPEEVWRYIFKMSDGKSEWSEVKSDLSDTERT